MQVKFNKDALLKHRFWIMLGVAALLIFFGIIYLEFIYGGPEAARTVLNGIDGKSKTKKDKYFSQDMIAAMEKKASISIKKETDRWAELYRSQAPLFRWAPDFEKKFDYANGYFALEIKVSKAGDPKTWPEDKSDLMHGTFIPDEGKSASFFLKPRNNAKPIRFYTTDSLTNVTLVDEGNKQIAYTDLLRLPGKRMLAVTYQKGRYFGDTLTRYEQDAFQASYRSQIHDILKIVDPVDEKLDGVVQLRDWLFSPTEFPPPTAKFIRYITDDFETVQSKPVSKETWIAQENIWIQKEIYRIIRSANDELSRYLGTGGKEFNKAYTFANPSFQVELNLDAKTKKLSFKLTNLLDRQQAIDLNYRVLLSATPGVEPEVLRVSGNPLKPKGFHVQEFEAEKSPRDAVLKVEQILTWQTAAIKRIDQISIGSIGGDEISHSHRTFVDGLKPLKKEDEEALAAAVGGKPGEGPGPGRGAEFKGRPAGPGFPGPGPGGPGGFGVGGAAGNQGQLELGLWSYRYLPDDQAQEYKQFRRIPVAAVLIIDQDHVDRVLTAFNNSKLRFLSTQVLLNQYLGSLQPPARLDANEPGFGPGPVPGGPRGGEFGGFRGGRPFGPAIGPGPGRGPGPGGPGFGMPGQPDDPSASGQETNLELVIYGIMTLYQRYPAPPKMATAPTPPPKN